MAPLLYAVTGDIGSGKTTFLKTLAAAAECEGVQAGGFIQKRIDVTGRTANAYDVVRLQSGESKRIAMRDKTGQFIFDDSVFDAALDWIKADLLATRLIVLDEIGLIESAGQGHARTLTFLLEQTRPLVVCMSLRKQKASDWMRKLAIDSTRVLNLPALQSEQDAFTKRVIQSVHALTN